jgi:hypothetical protein
MNFNKRGILILFTILITAMLVGCDIPFIDKKPSSNQENGTEKQSDQPQTKEQDSKNNAKVEPVAEPDDQQQAATPKGPKLIINLPDNMTTNYESLQVSGTTTSGTTVYMNGAVVRIKGDGSFSGKLNLKPGANTVEVVAVDKNQNSTTIKRSVHYTINQPSLRVFAPVESTTTNVNISGHTDPDCMVYINNSKVKADKKGSFSGAVEITNQGANVINITAVNKQGVSTTSTKTIRGIPPKVQVAAPDLITDDKATISGITDVHTSIVVLIGSKKATVDNNNGIFDTTVELEPGINDVTVIATNLFGSTEIPLSILYDDYGKEKK